MKKVEAVSEITKFLTDRKDTLAMCKVSEKMIQSRIKKLDRAEYPKIIKFYESLADLDSYIKIYIVLSNNYTISQWAHLKELGDMPEIVSLEYKKKSVYKYWQKMPRLDK